MWLVCLPQAHTHLNCDWKDKRNEERPFTIKFVSTLFGIVHPGSELGHLGHHVVQLGRLPLALHYDRKHSHTSQHRPFTPVNRKNRIRKDKKQNA